MKSKFGLLGKMEFLQNWASSFISSLSPAVIHNIEKYVAIKKTVYLNSLEHQTGDYLEFGVYTGSSFCHAIKCFKKTEKFNPNQNQTKFIGFDSFEGFGELEEEDKHPFYVDQNFTTSYKKVKKRAERTIKGWGAGCQLVQGYFEDSLKADPSEYGIKEVRIAFIDSDTYSSSKCAFDFMKNNVRNGTHIILDDFYSYNGDPNKGVSLAFKEFIADSGYKFRKILDYGMGGIVVVLHQ